MLLDTAQRVKAAKRGLEDKLTDGLQSVDLKQLQKRQQYDWCLTSEALEANSGSHILYLHTATMKLTQIPFGR